MRNAALMLMPHLRRGAGRVGFGDASFDDLDKDKTFNAAWQVVQGQMNSEGASSLDITSAQGAFANAYQDLFNQGLNATEALGAAQKYVAGVHTIAGAAESVAGLVQAATGGGVPPLALMQMVTGTMIGVAVAAGVASAGVGAAIVAGVAALSSLLGGLFGQSPGYQIPGCAGSASTPPAWAVGCMGYFPPSGRTADDMRTMPNSTLWRRFPDPNNPADAGWFMPSNSVPTADGGAWLSLLGGPPGAARPIDIAWPQYYTLECQAKSASPDPLGQAFFTAWKLNQEYGLNGLQAQSDWRVLAHVLRLWNKSHSSAGRAGTVVIGNGGVQLNPGDPCVGGLAYEGTLVDTVLRNPVPGDEAITAGGSLFYNAGALIQPPTVTGLRFRLRPSKPTTSTLATVATGGAVVAGAGALGIALLAYVKGWGFSKAANHVWDKTGGRVVKAVRRHL